jgi:hypothetical protein
MFVVVEGESRLRYVGCCINALVHNINNREAIELTNHAFIARSTRMASLLLVRLRIFGGLLKLVKKVKVCVWPRAWVDPPAPGAFGILAFAVQCKGHTGRDEPGIATH